MLIEKVEYLLNGERRTKNSNGQPIPNRVKESNGDVTSGPSTPPSGRNRHSANFRLEENRLYRRNGTR
jgi:hypothetical protein